MSDHDDDLIEYETETDDMPEPAAVPVCLDGPVVTVGTVPQHATCSTVVLTDDQPVAQLVALDHLRAVARVTSLDNDVVICHSFQQAMDASNQTTDLAMPNGYVLAAGASETLETTQELWIASGAAPSRVSVIVERRSG